jgi:hypothetical protein
MASGIVRFQILSSCEVNLDLLPSLSLVTSQNECAVVNEQNLSVRSQISFRGSEDQLGI